RLAAEREIASFTDAAADARREHQRAIESAEKARMEMRSLLMTHLALLERTSGGNGLSHIEQTDSQTAQNAQPEQVTETERITVY
ncbi:MAG TPA: hypothetical protein VFE17_03650, partial [Candidatus Baltobacteraceae bacterium]|nr:hypothetical protein [Candidatus Baltobacteraceae bacterium]